MDLQIRLNQMKSNLAARSQARPVSNLHSHRITTTVACSVGLRWALKVFNGTAAMIRLCTVNTRDKHQHNNRMSCFLTIHHLHQYMRSRSTRVRPEL